MDFYTSARPEVRGTADVGWRSLFPLPHSRLYHHMCLRIDSSDGHERKDADAALRTILCCLRRRECCMLGAPSSQPTVPLHELPPARLVIHRQTSAHERRKWTRSVQSRSGILAYLCTRQNWLWITVELHIPGARHGEAVAREGGRYAPVRRISARNHLALERIDIVVGHGRSGVPLSRTRLHQ